MLNPKSIVREEWHKLDRNIHEQLNGEYSRAAVREAAVFALMWASHKRLKARLPQKFHLALDGVWYGTWVPDHPLHGVRAAIQREIADWAEGIDAHYGKPVEHKFRWLDTQIPRLERFIDKILA
jgi:hypothetical protein